MCPAGIHGDEPGSTEGLIAWAEAQGRNLARLPSSPSMPEPVGLVNNRRSDERNNDLNRSFHREDLAVISAVKRLATPHQFAASLMLHEDYDGQGVYLYEIQRVQPYWARRCSKRPARTCPSTSVPASTGGR